MGAPWRDQMLVQDVLLESKPLSCAYPPRQPRCHQWWCLLSLPPPPLPMRLDAVAGVQYSPIVWWTDFYRLLIMTNSQNGFQFQSWHTILLQFGGERSRSRHVTALATRSKRHMETSSLGFCTESNRWGSTQRVKWLIWAVFKTIQNPCCLIFLGDYTTQHIGD